MSSSLAKEPSTIKPTTSVGDALDGIGLTKAHYVILLLVLAGGFFDVFEQNGAAVTGPSLKLTWGLSDSSVAFIATATFIAMVVGGLVTGVVADKYGRKTLFNWNLLIYALGGLLCAFAPNYWVLILGRIVVGLGLGGELTIALPLLSELMPTKFRGTAVSLFNMGAGGFGNPLAFLFGALILGVLGPQLGGDTGAWRWYFGLLALPALLVLVIRRHVPETPRFLVSRGRIDEANEALTHLASGRLRDHSRPTQYLSADAHIESSGQAQGRASFGEVFRGKLARNTLTVGIGSFLSFGGQLAILTLMPIILVDRGYSITGSLGFTAVMQGGALLGTVVASWVNYRFPRRHVMFVSAVLAAATGTGFAVLGTNLAGILIFGALFNFFVLLCNTTVWAWAPELYPTRVRATGTGVVVNSGMLGQALMPLVAAPVFNGAGLIGLFGMVAAMYIALGFLALAAPETFGKNLEQLHGEVAVA